MATANGQYCMPEDVLKDFQCKVVILLRNGKIVAVTSDLFLKAARELRSRTGESSANVRLMLDNAIREARREVCA